MFFVDLFTFAGLLLECVVLEFHSDRVAGTCSSTHQSAIDSCLLDASRVAAEGIVTAASYLFQFQSQFLLLLPATNQVNLNSFSVYFQCFCLCEFTCD